MIVMPARTIAIGDIHGCSLALAALIGAIEPGPGDTLIPLGDFIDCGPSSREVLEQLIALAGRCTLVPILGNHEEMLLAAAWSPSALKEWLFCGGKQTLASYGAASGPGNPVGGLTSIIPEEHWRLIAGCLPYYETEMHIFTHAGYLPDLPMEQQSGQALRWQLVDPKTARPHCSGKVVLVGHTSQRSGDILDLGFLKCIDTACEPGQWLTALEVDTGRIWQANKRGQVRR
jgi:serine/threonine protein phosphatase 1